MAARERSRCSASPPITLDGPKPDDTKASDGESSLPRPYSPANPAALMADLVALNQFESEQERKVR
jgi:poly(A) polymerase